MRSLTLVPVLVVLLLLIVFSPSVTAQTIDLAIGAGYSSMSPAIEGTFSYTGLSMSSTSAFDEVSGRKSTPGYNILSRLEFHLSSIPLSVTAGISYAELFGKADYVRAPSPLWFNSVYTVGELESRTHILCLRPGLQLSVIQSPITVYVGAELLYSIVGDTKLTIKSGSSTMDGTIAGDTRLGAAVGAGARMRLAPPVDISIETGVALHNLVRPEPVEEAWNSFNITVALHLNII